MSARLRRSDVDMVSWFPVGQHTLDPADFKKWGATVVTWGLDSAFTHTNNVPESLDLVVAAAHKGGVRDYLANLDMCSAMAWNLAKDPELAAAISRDFDGKGLVVPWFSHLVNGIPSYWGCINNPVYQENVRNRVRAGHAAGCKGLHVDCANGSVGVLRRHGGCYCQYCMDGFRAYLQETYSSAQLRERGVDLKSFDFRAMMRAAVGTPAKLEELYSSGRGIDGREPAGVADLHARVPLFADFEQFNVEASVDWLKQLQALTKRVGGPDAPFSVNARGILRWQRMREVADFFTSEIGHAPEQGTIPARLVAGYRACESLGKMISVTAGTVGDWHQAAKGGMDHLVALWIAFAYANGHCFIVPNRVWCYSKERGEHEYVGPEELLLPLYRFVRQRAELFDDYEPVEQVGVVASTLSALRNREALATSTTWSGRTRSTRSTRPASDCWTRRTESWRATRGRPCCPSRSRSTPS